ncbi:ligase-associated DNA damage response endonuclease PdeM [Sinorhizobium medicae]|uniref:Metallophosphoesterase n=1 Tax=Sinorhizobium medicae TaxID=110321 RepID=A0A508WTK7_9HYPH|nr:ligase-associated DNA damage response endonuclease PdeM [Sinorhizobium medicae]MBO1940584.1 ligase-associated DNA damage response endonuclease PdeM [Sinorhizobium medicae]MDX0422186.1 ligase-associated DNA damage response endonuclease PdeM [Sinorhizobium medicae]MDX0429675.1 ligase-associated DNA damage response endonuclease PdeM [Sinorhizobium medicae]MDX0443263.1 ligase-associated DNA damage response endonuclease PdeM [Sinorhizobium medicae]MDX0462367.1 ligase-associated DNA damage respon
MHRLLHAISAPAANASIQTRTTINGVAAICDPLGGLYLPEGRTLVVSDLHLEKGSAFARRGMMLPPYDTLATLRILEAVVARHSPATVISLGDNFHDRKGSAAMPENFRQMVAAMARGREWIWINGNHDPDGAQGLPGTSMDELRHAGLVFRHEPSTGDGIGEIAGHLHPSATVRRRERSVRRACFATDGRRLVMPAFGVTTGGLDLRHPAMTGLFDRQQLIAHMLGRDRIYSVRFANLLG